MTELAPEGGSVQELIDEARDYATYSQTTRHAPPSAERLLLELCDALATERDRADRAEARLLEARKAMDANQTVDGVTDRGWLTPDEWLLNKVAEALGKDEATT